MAVVVYRVEADANRYVSFCDTRRLLFAAYFKEMCNGLSLISKWQPAKVDVVEGRIGDFAGGPTHFATIAVSDGALATVRPLVESACELLPFSHAERRYWALYIPWPSDCLDWEGSSFYFNRKRIEDLDEPKFIISRIPIDKGLFRLPSRFEYYCTQDFKDAVEAAGLTGLSFRFVWSSDGSVPKEPKRKKATKNVQRIVKETTRRTKRDLLLARLWEAIDSFGSEERLNLTLSVKPADMKGAQDVIAADSEVLKKAETCGIPKKQLQRLCRSIAYKAVFETLVAIEEECLDRPPELKGLHEDLLMADPQK